MSLFCVPPLEDKPWPSLGWLLVPWAEKNLVFGPGDLRGEPLKLSPERKALIYRMYELYPEGDPRAGRRRFRRCGLSVRKGVGKTEFAAIVAGMELHPAAPVRCIGFDKKGRPLGGPVRDPYIPIVAYTEEQSEDLAYGALRAILSLSPVAGDFDIGLERIMRKRGDGKAVALASAPDARDGARTTFQVADETHRWTLPRLKNAHRTMLANLPKRRLSDAWGLEVTTASSPGEGSVAEDTMQYARAVAQGEKADSRLFFFHRQASDEHDLTTAAGRRAAVLEASGPDAEWSDIDGIVEQWDDPTADRAYLERVWLNRPVKAADQAFDGARWAAAKRPDYRPADGALITLGFDGGRTFDATALIGTEIETGFQFRLGLWEKPLAAQRLNLEWRVPEAEVDAAVRDAFARFDVWRMYADPPHWEETVAKWAGEFKTADDEERVIRWPTNRWDKIAHAVLAYANAIINGELSHDGDPAFAQHVGNSRKRMLTLRDDRGNYLWVIQKERPDSPMKIDGAMAGILSWRARLDALAAGVEPAPPEWDGTIVALA